MKRFIFGFFGGLILSSTVFAQNFELETVRTPEVPGFFMIRIFAGENNTPLPIQNVFVQNYSEEEASKYEELIPFIEEFGGKIVGIQSLSEYAISQYNRIVFLGEDPTHEFLSFLAPVNDQILEEFEKFSRENLGPIFIENITLSLGGNASEIFPTNPQTLGNDPVYFVGKFEKPMKTRMEIKGNWSEGDFFAEAPVNLNDEDLSHGPIAKELPYIWEELWKLENAPQEIEKPATPWNFSMIDAFPFILLLLGCVVFYRIIVEVKRRRKQDNIFEESIKLNQNPQNWEKSLQPPVSDEDLPFTVEKKQ
ncbi:hypothetical protein K9L27_02970 [Candidatus Gracilibacteria bacterium]|nr:hypothetical protein [Candidatus Gracilibacteria bacterium]